MFWEPERLCLRQAPHVGFLAVSLCSPRTEQVTHVPPTLSSARPSEGQFCRNPHCAGTWGGQARPRDVSGAWPPSSTCRGVVWVSTGDRGRCDGRGDHSLLGGGSCGRLRASDRVARWIREDLAKSESFTLSWPILTSCGQLR